MRANHSLPTPLPTMFTVDGDLAGEAVLALAERLWPHVLTGPPETLVDLARAKSLDAAGLDLLVATHAYAAHRRIPLRTVNVAPHLRRALHAAGVSALLARSPHGEVTTTATSPAPRRDAAVVMA